MDSFDEEDIVLTVEETDDGTAIRITYTTKSNRKVYMEEFLLEVEAYAKECLRSAELASDPSTTKH
jgi:hypothetical protein